MQTNKVNGIDQRECIAYLRIPVTGKKLPLIVNFAGTGIYSTGTDDFLGSNYETVFNNNKAMVLTIDKPGISVNKESKEGFIVNHDIYDQYTQRDLVECGMNAIKWVEQSNHRFNQRIVLRGHSEGAEVVTRIFLQSLKTNTKLASKIELLLLSGVPMTDWKTILKEQLSPTHLRKFKKFLKNKDNEKLIEFGGIGYAYFEEAFKMPSLAHVFDEIAQFKPQAKFSIYHGLNDKNTPCSHVQDYERKNREKLEKKIPALNWEARYYLSRHWLNKAASNDMMSALLGF